MDGYVVNSEVMSVLPIELLLTFGSVDSFDGEPITEVLERKRKDGHYSKIVESLLLFGWTTGVHIAPDRNEITDGHHRLAAAIDLGQRYVPVVTELFSAHDSGFWGRD